MGSGQFRNIAHLKLKVDAETFLAVAKECSAFADDEPGCLIYDWYLDRENGTCDVVAVFDSPDAMLWHCNRGFDEVLRPKLAGVADIVFSDTYGELGEELSRILGPNRKKHGAPAIEAGRWVRDRDRAGAVGGDPLTGA